MEDVPRLKKLGYTKESFSKNKKEELFILREDKLIYPKDMKFYVKKRMEREKSLIGIVYKDDIWIETANRINNVLERYLEIIESTGEKNNFTHWIYMASPFVLTIYKFERITLFHHVFHNV